MEYGCEIYEALTWKTILLHKFSFSDVEVASESDGTGPVNVSIVADAWSKKIYIKAEGRGFK